jgi:hypothetical protein
MSQNAKSSDAYVELSAGKQELLKRRMSLASRCVMQARLQPRARKPCLQVHVEAVCSPTAAACTACLHTGQGHGRAQNRSCAVRGCGRSCVPYRLAGDVSAAPMGRASARDRGAADRAHQQSEGAIRPSAHLPTHREGPVTGCETGRVTVCTFSAAVQDQQDACREVEAMPELAEVTPDMTPADVRRLIVQRGGTIPAEEAQVH